MKSGNSAAIKKLFNTIAPSYDRLNDVLSLGLHRQWKRQVVRSLKPVPGEIWLDLCCGTGDIALELSRHVRPKGRVIGLDTAAVPLKLARERQRRQPWLPVTFNQGDALATKLPSRSVDGIVMAYGLRNLTDPAMGLREMHRLLKPSGRAGVLDLNRLISSTAAAIFQRFYFRQLVVPVAAAIGLGDEYAYLERSLQRFPVGTDQEAMANTAGFSKSQHRSMAGGQMGLLLLHA
ncbi:bifunctional demethylmenaquinone methyltransferase/2-methoxy-6-polyprenyl-1,4-benzoquinol methylase UbiE [Synechococcus sp. M16CYN]|uniref:bifunctional demethylmenaquinone methyltransferase/2-methoxy-6-polyprenyl-1,4-benzoquinol methylase UbiE n=1 Tax=Synechococcus sp. M16CYN TaxID=3103139 RepID=UPI00324586CE